MTRDLHMLSNHHTLPGPTLVSRKSTLCLRLLSRMATLPADTTKAIVVILPLSPATHRGPSEPTLPQLDLSLRMILPRTLSARRQCMVNHKCMVPRHLTAASLSRKSTLPANRPRKRRRSHTHRPKPPRSNKQLPPSRRPVPPRPSRPLHLRLSRSSIHSLSCSLPLSPSHSLSLKHNLSRNLKLKLKLNRNQSHVNSRAVLPMSMIRTRHTPILTYKRGRSIMRRVGQTRPVLSTSSLYLGSKKDPPLRPLSHSRHSPAVVP